MSCETAEAVLKNRTLKWSPASAFNDPFDMQFDLHLDFDEEDLVTNASETLETSYWVAGASCLGLEWVTFCLDCKPPHH